jgi:hypothetical protein
MMDKEISSHGGMTLDDFTESNCSGRFQHQVGGHAPFGIPYRKVWGYYITTPKRKVECPQMVRKISSH